jgi:hypothetical protein
MDMAEQNEAELRFATYLDDYGYSWKHEPDYQAEVGLPKRLETRPDFLIDAMAIVRWRRYASSRQRRSRTTGPSRGASAC